MKRDYPRLEPEAFGKLLIETGDLDPLYIAIASAPSLKGDKLKRFLVAYWCLYHAGVAAWIAEQDVFHSHLKRAALNVEPSPLGGRWPRGAERRHWRGAQAVESAEELSYHWPSVARWVDHLRCADREGPVDFEEVRSRAMSARGFGPWIAFKIGDMIDVLDLKQVLFDDSEVLMFSEPRKGALMVAMHKLRLGENARLKDEEWAIKEVVDHLRYEFRDLKAPPLHRRGVGVQEIETVLCKWKSHVNGHYPPGKDTLEIAEGLREWANASPTAAELLEALPIWSG